MAILLADLLHARTRNLNGERNRQRVLRICLPCGAVKDSAPAAG